MPSSFIVKNKFSLYEFNRGSINVARDKQVLSSMTNYSGTAQPMFPGLVVLIFRSFFVPTLWRRYRYHVTNCGIPHVQRFKPWSPEGSFIVPCLL